MKDFMNNVSAVNASLSTASKVDVNEQASKNVHKLIVKYLENESENGLAILLNMVAKLHFFLEDYISDNACICGECCQSDDTDEDESEEEEDYMDCQDELDEDAVSDVINDIKKAVKNGNIKVISHTVNKFDKSEIKDFVDSLSKTFNL